MLFITSLQPPMQVSNTQQKDISALLGDNAAQICTLTAALLSHLPSSRTDFWYFHYQAIMNTFLSMERILFTLYEMSSEANRCQYAKSSQKDLREDLGEPMHELCFTTRRYCNEALASVPDIEHIIVSHLIPPSALLYIQHVAALLDSKWIPPRLAALNTARSLSHQLKTSLRDIHDHLSVIDTAIDRMTVSTTPFSHDLVLPTASDLLWFNRHLELMQSLSPGSIMLPFDPNECKSVEKWSGVTAHHDSQQPPLTSVLLKPSQPLRRVFEDLDKADPKVGHSELSKHVSSVIGVAGPVLQGLASTFCLPTEPWSQSDCDIYPALKAIFESAPSTELNDIVAGPEHVLVRDILVHFDLKARENIRALRYWIHHIRLVTKAVDQFNNWPGSILPLKASFSVFDVLVQGIGVYSTYRLQSTFSSNVFHWIQHWTFAASVGLSLTAAFNPLENVHPREPVAKVVMICLTVLFGFLCTYTLIPALVSQEPNDAFSESLSIMCMDIFLYALHLGHRIMRPPPPDLRREQVIPAMRNVICELNDLVNWWEELRVAIGSVSRPHVPHRLSPEESHTVFDNFTSRYIGAADSCTRPHFGGLQPMVSSSTMMFDNSFVKCPILHPRVWSKKIRAWEFTTCPLCDVTATRQLEREKVLARREEGFEGKTQPAKMRRV